MNSFFQLTCSLIKCLAYLFRTIAIRIRFKFNETKLFIIE